MEILQDITDLKQMEQDLRASEETARALMNASSESALLIDTQGTVLAANEIAARRVGTTVEQMVGTSLFNHYSTGPLDRRRTSLGQVLNTSRPAYFEDERDGKSFDTYIYPVFNADGHIIRLAVFAEDITERKQAEKALRASEEKFSTVFHFSPDAIAIAREADGTFLDVNENFTKMLGYERSDIVGKKWMEFTSILSPEGQDRVTRLFQEIGTLTDYDLDFTTREGKPATMLLSLIPITVSGEACILAIGHDITERKQSEEALRQAQAELALGLQERTALQERQRLARELHDSVSQALYGISLGDAHRPDTVRHRPDQGARSAKLRPCHGPGRAH